MEGKHSEAETYILSETITYYKEVPLLFYIPKEYAEQRRELDKMVRTNGGYVVPI